jgi:hypothetical protein
MSDMSAQESPAEAAARPALADCDMVMKGGITSGVVYPRAAVQLSRRYRFRRLGGASAGGIAAALVAAAEHGRATGGFAKLDAVPSELASHLSTLFQPSPATAPAYALLMRLVDKEHSWSWRVLGAIGTVAGRTWPVIVIAFFAAAAVAVGIDTLARGWPGWGDVSALFGLWSPVLLVVALLAGVVWLALRTLEVLPANGFGLCDGHTRSLHGHPPLTDWMVSTLDDLAGIAPTDPPLTFGHLWGARAVEDYVRAVGDKSEGELMQRTRREIRRHRAIDVEVMTTNVTLRRPYRFPFETRIFWYCEDCWRRYFPERIIVHLRQCSTEVHDRQTEDPASGGQRAISTRCPEHGKPVRTLPRAPDMPVVVAARLSLSFPGLVSAIPLYVIDWGRVAEHRQLIRVWFSDGGIASNFPMHLFDSWWPQRPTFGINLQPLTVEHGPELVRKPRGALPRSHPIDGAFAFASGMVRTMQNWVDTTQLTMPGYRDRVVEIRHRETEGGINLNMPDDMVRDLADRGAAAAMLLDDFNLPDHQRTRVETSLAGIDGALAGMLEASATPGLGQVLAAMTPADRRAVCDNILQLARGLRAGGHAADRGDVPSPQPDLRFVPRQ